jgi:hypothetical protein
VKQPKIDFLEILKVLWSHGVECIVVGGVSGVLHGAPMTTLDLDVVHSRAPENIDRLLRALEELEAFARGQGDRRMRPDRTHLDSPGHQLLMTKHGPLDLLGAVGAGRGYEDLAGHSVEMRLAALVVKVLDIDTLIELKEQTGRDKDVAVIALLRRTRDEARRSGDR